MSKKILSANFDLPDSHALRVYEETGGYRAIRKILGTPGDEIIEEVKKSGLRGRGGAGFPAGVKWGFVPKDTDQPKYLCVNADEGEPGTFKDRQIMEQNPHMLIEGILICSYAVGIERAYVYVRGEYVFQIQRLAAAIAEAYGSGYLGKNILGSDFNLDVVIHRGAGAYICGEETGLIESLEGKKGQPRAKPPFPAVVGAFGCPTVVNNVETLSSLPFIINEGASAYAAIGTAKSTGTMLFSVSGMVEKPGVYEEAFGVNLVEFIEERAGGVLGGKALKAVIPGGSSAPILTADEARNTVLDYEALAEAGSMLGSGAIIVLSEDVCIVKALQVITRFYSHESCGQCPPCRHGTYWLARIADRIENGRGEPDDIDLLLSICPEMMGRTICVLCDAAAMPTESYVKKFREEFEEHIRLKKCPMDGAPRLLGIE
ncbi:MAG: NADH-quinone oxidoreductase subunit NuoF [Candidatus Latescibacteria bacterium]|nr:NADH-quinone oxidoreductase subunit NuoF [Candidatus Latescibacterota bacterium]NIM21999.1 NADH-quinone oxidoreductase subunit NuoF [Candidatus Latescibacterota bacterium]NIM66017.1 NADH-quinone oxidoreductase subunit NuoF [Candidatus Latescibacterota bacterium]NIO02425.1 NADH-quinone oxidoreductase subunit NuoF [Candidatus Latescibacterota bacterium]NIO29336.1 NADH-quinone oxidoreductase subunit NuoF [Candidatus Latescibacterota bacterium]